MFRGTTPTFNFTLPIQAETVTEAAVSFCQSTGLSIDKTLADCTLSGNTLSVSLTEAETLSLTSGKMYPLLIQLRLGVGEARMASQVFTVPVERILKDGAL